jgi:hypothetical protein
MKNVPAMEVSEEPLSEMIEQMGLLLMVKTFSD